MSLQGWGIKPKLSVGCFPGLASETQDTPRTPSHSRSKTEKRLSFDSAAPYFVSNQIASDGLKGATSQKERTERLRETLFKKRQMALFYKRECERRRHRYEQDWKDREIILSETIQNLSKLVQIQSLRHKALVFEINSTQSQMETQSSRSPQNSSLSISLETQETFLLGD